MMTASCTCHAFYQAVSGMLGHTAEPKPSTGPRHEGQCMQYNITVML